MEILNEELMQVMDAMEDAYDYIELILVFGDPPTSQEEDLKNRVNEALVTLRLVELRQQ